MANTNVTINGIATLASGFAQRQVLAKYVDAYRDEMGYFDWMEMMSGGEEVTGVPIFDHLEEDTVQSIATTIAGTTSAGTGGALVASSGTVTSSSADPTITKSGGVTALGTSNITSSSPNIDHVHGTTVSFGAGTSGGASATDHAHTYSGTTDNTGSGGAHNNLQPYIVLNYIIKAA